jgi:hypothetical protein
MAQTALAARPADTGPVPSASDNPIHDMLEAKYLAEEIRVGLDRMRRMSHDELRALVASRIEMLDGVLREREQRREALETARLAANILEIRRERSHAIRRHVNAWSAVAAVVCFAAIFAQI